MLGAPTWSFCRADFQLKEERTLISELGTCALAVEVHSELGSAGEFEVDEGESGASLLAMRSAILATNRPSEYASRSNPKRKRAYC